MIENIAYRKAIELLQRVNRPSGFMAALKNDDNYERVWTRDSALCGLAALATGDEQLQDTYRRSIETIWAHQHPAGFVPSNVSASGAVSYGGIVGRVDNHAWIVISTCQYAHVTNKSDWAQSFENKIEKCFQLMNAWEFNGRGLMYVPQSADWADEYFHHGYILYNQLLRLWALRSAAVVYNRADFADEAKRIQNAVENYFSGNESYAIQTKRLQNRNTDYWVMGFNPSKMYYLFDLQANALALLLGIGSKEKRESTINYINRLLLSKKMLPSFHPVINDTDDEMKELQNNYAYSFRNHPNEFHNGGLWPVWNGFAAMSLGSFDIDAVENIKNKVALYCSMNDWEFNECFHGETGAPAGVPYCSWSAAGLIFSFQPSILHSLIR